MCQFRSIKNSINVDQTAYVLPIFSDPFACSGLSLVLQQFIGALEISYWGFNLCLLYVGFICWCWAEVVV